MSRILIHDYAGHAFPVSLSRALAQRGHTVCHGFASNLQTPRGALHRIKDDPPSLQFEAIPMSADYVKDKYSFVRRRQHEKTYGGEVEKFIKRWKPEVVLSGNTPTETQGSIVNSCGQSGAAFCYWVQDFYSLAVTKLVRKRLPVLGELISAYYRRLDRDHLRRSAAVVSITEDFEAQLNRWGIPEDRSHVVPNWAELDAFSPTPKDNRWGQEQGLVKTFNFVYSGTLGMKHNPELLARLATAFKDDSAMQLIVVTEGLGAEFLSKAKKDRQLNNLRILPFQPFERLPEVLGTADVLITILEPDAGVFSVPSKTLSYLCSGRPVLGSMPKSNLAARIVTDEGAGIVVEPDDQNGFLAAAKKLRADSELRAKMGSAARAYAERTFDISAITDRFEAIFEKAIKVTANIR